MDNYKRIFTMDIVKFDEHEKNMFIDNLMEIIHSTDTREYDIKTSHKLISEMKWPLSSYPAMVKRLNEETLLNIAYYIYAIENKVLSKMEGYNNIINLFLSSN